jgi:phthiocerol/phenolphthiocerol synthesis type-I polyketide synthase E
MSIDDPTPDTPPDIAIVGMACRFPGADGVERFWQNLREGIDSVSRFSDAELAAAGVPEALYRQPDYVKAHAVLPEVDRFDAGFFGYSPREAEVMDPQQRLFLECAWEALENAGYDPARLPGAVGVWGGMTLSSYLMALAPLKEKLQALGVDTTMLAVGNDKDSLAPRVAYKLDLRGPAVSVQTACSTSLVAVHMACQSLLAEESDVALAGAVSITLPMVQGYLYQEGGILSPDGRSRTFDARAAGTVFGCGLGIVVLKRLEDALIDGDTVHAVIKGTAVNNDGATKAGFTAPSVSGQAEVIAEALGNAGLSADEIGFVEAHGTATALGDPVEIAALTKAFRRSTERRGFCAIGSVKTNFGHLEVASGIAGLIKAVLAVENAEIPPSLHFETPNPQIDFASSPFYVATALSPWPEGTRRAGVSSFGFGGTNAHVVLEEAPAPAPAAPAAPWQLLTLSARSAAALDAATARLADHLAAHPGAGIAELADAAYTLQLGRRAFEHRRAVACESAADALLALSGGDPTRLSGGVHDGRERPVYFLFPGQGAQHPAMGRDTYRAEPLFRRELDRLAEMFVPHLGGLDLRELILGDPGDAALAERLNATETAQPALFAVEMALARLWRSWGVEPRALIGHSLGELTAACLAGVFSVEDAVALVAARGRLMGALPPGDMLAVPMAEAELLPLLPPEVDVSAVHGPEMTIAAGPSAAVLALQAALAERGVEAGKLHTSHAFHSSMMDPILEPFAAEVRKAALKAPRIPFISGVTGRFLSPAEATDPAYWARQIRQPVRLGDGLATLLAKPAVLLEVGPAQALAGAVRQHPAKGPAHAVASSWPHPKHPRNDAWSTLQALGALWAAGVPVDWKGVHAEHGRRRRVPLPAYPFERQRYFIDATGLSAATPAPAVRASAAAAPAAAPAPPVPQPAAPAAPADAGGSYVAARYATGGGTTGYVAPRNEIEEILADMWGTLLGVERVGVEDNFFRLNGNSLIALQAISRIQSVFGVKLTVRSFFEKPTVAELAAIVAERQPGLEALEAKARILQEMEQEVAPETAAAPVPEAPSAAPAGDTLDRALAALPPPALAARGGADPDGSGMKFSLFFFSGDEAMFPAYKYQLIVEGAKFADRHGFTAIWTPERHFHSFGGLYPNPSVLSAAIAMVTERLAVRAGSVVMPIHNPIRVAEEWSIVDNLSRGRAGISFASGFHPNDFTFAPDAYPARRDVMFEKIETFRRLWRGERVRVPGGAGNEIEVELFPKPVQREVPIWITCSNSPSTFEMTGAIGANVLTSLIGLTTDALAERIALYRKSRAEHGHDPRTGQVAVMLHTFVGDDLARVKETVRRPFCSYLRSHTELLTSLAKSLHQSFDEGSFSKDDLEDLLEMEFERYFASGSLLGTPESCLAMVRKLAEIGVDEAGCLLDFGVDVPSVMDSLTHLDELRRRAGQEALVAG